MKKGGQKLIDLTGRKFGRLTVISLNRRDERRSYHWNCECSCGNLKIVRGIELREGHTKSCGCIVRERVTKHGDYQGSPTKEYSAWRNIKARCLNKNSISYKNYGGRGIKVCERWIDSYECFLKDIGRAPTPEHSIDRIDNNGNYEPGNCRWATRKEQMNNTRINVMIDFLGKNKSFSQWCRELNISITTAHNRMRKNKLTSLQIIKYYAEKV